MFIPTSTRTTFKLNPLGYLPLPSEERPIELEPANEVKQSH